jgi:ubiquitin thioesterase protein OTUB1
MTNEQGSKLTIPSSHYNTAHFNNPDFEPEQWTPENDYAAADRPRKKSSHSA